MKIENKILNAKTIKSFGSTGCYIDDELNEDYIIQDLDKITEILDNANLDYKIKSLFDEDEIADGMPADEWIITIK